MVNLKLHFNKIYLFLCLAGLTWHVYYISFPYFQFAIMTKISIDWPEDEMPKSINFGFAQIEIDPNRTINDLWERSPSIKDMAPVDKYCGYVNQLLCSDVVVDKYLYRKWPFYSFSPPIGKTNDYVISREYFTYHSQEDIFTIKLNIPKMSSEYLAIGSALSDMRESPLNVIQRALSYVPIKSNSYYFFDHKNLNVEKLKAPFTDSCYDYSVLHCKYQRVCLTQCIDNTTSEIFGGVNYAAFVTQSGIDKFKKYFEYNDFEKDKIVIYDKIISDCKARYSKPECTTHTVLSTVQPVLFITSGLDNVFIFSYELSGKPSTIVKSHELIPFVDFITFIFGSLGTWLGFSFLGTGSDLKSKVFKQKANQVIDSFREQAQIEKMKRMNAQIKYLKAKSDYYQDQLTDCRNDNVKLELLLKTEIQKMKLDFDKRLENKLSTRKIR